MSYDHAKGGKATNYYIREYDDSGVEKKTTQMFTNSSNNDLAVIYNFAFTEASATCFKIYNAADSNNNTAYYGSGSLVASSPAIDDFSAHPANGVNDNISKGASGKYYDIYFNSSSQIYITYHGEITTSDEMGNETGWYICGNNSSDPKSSLYGMDGTVTTGIPMYVNAAKASDSSKPDIAYYAGLRLSSGDVFWIMRGADLETHYYAKANGSSGSFTHDSTNHVVTCNQLGYYTVALLYSTTSGNTNGVYTDNQLFLSEWDGMEVNGSTRYTIKNRAAPTSGATKRNLGSSSSETIYFKDATWWSGNGSNQKTYIYLFDDYLYFVPNSSWNSGGARFAIYCNDGTWTDLAETGSGTGVFRCNFPSSNQVIFCRMNGSTSENNWNNKWNQTPADQQGYHTISHDSNKWTMASSGWDGAGGTATEERTKNATYPGVEMTHVSPASFSTSQPNIFSHTFDATTGYQKVVFSRSNGNSYDAKTDDVVLSDAGANNMYDISSTSARWTGNQQTVTGTWGSLPTYTITYVESYGGNNDTVGTDSVLSGNTWTVRSITDRSASGYGSPASWSGSNGSTYTPGGTGAAINSDITLTATYTGLTRYDVTFKVYKDGTELSSSSDYYYSSGTKSSVTSPLMPATNYYGYTTPTKWRTVNDGKTGTAYNPNASITPGSVTLYATYVAMGTKTYYFDVHDVASSFATNGLTLNIWNDSVSNSAVAATRVDGSYDDWWEVTVPYYSDAYFQVYSGSNKQSSSSKYQLSAKDGDIFKITAFTPGSNADGSCTGSWLNVQSSGDIRTVTLYRSRNRNGVLTNDSPALNTYRLLDHESWTLSQAVITDNYGSIAGYTTPTEFHVGSNSSATTKVRDNSWTITEDTTIYGVYSRQEYTFRVRQSAAFADASYETLASVAWNIEGDNSKTFENVHLGQGKIWYIDDNTANAGGSTYVGNILWEDIVLTNDSISISVTGATTATADKDYYFVQSGNNIRTKIGGTYDIVITPSTTDSSKKITAITLKSVDTTDFKILGNGGAFPDGDSDGTIDFDVDDGFAASSATGNGTTIDFSFGSKTFWINDKFKAAQPYTGGASTHSWSYSFSGLTNYFYTKEVNSITNIYSRVHIAATVTIKFTISSGAFSIEFSNGNETAPSNITFNHARNAGIYIETSANADFSNSTIQMMHTTSNASYRAQEAPITLSQNIYFRVFETKSNTTANNDTLTTEAAIRAATENYYTAMDNYPEGFASGTSGGIGHIKYSGSTNRWTISLSTSNQVHIDTYTGASTKSTEHHVPYYIIGRGMPGSDLRECDYTTEKGIQLYTYGNNAANLPAYAGPVGDAGDSVSPYGDGIALVKGDTFKFSDASKLIGSQSQSSGTGYSIASDGTVSITASGTYYVYLSGSAGSEVINISQKTAGSDSKRRNGDIVSQNGVTQISSSGNSLTFGGNLDYSLLDAYGTGKFIFEIQLTHVSSGAAGTMTYRITNGNNYEISVAKKDAVQSSATSYGSDQPISASGSYNSFERNIASGTQYTTLRITLTAAQIRSMMVAGSYTFSMTIAYSFVESSIS